MNALIDQEETSLVEPPGVAADQAWNYGEAFSRNRGLITREEQQVLRTSHVAIAGMGGVGGIELITLARLGIGRFTIADPDTFEVANTNRQYGATRSNMGRLKAEVMAEMVRDVNPMSDVRIVKEPLCRDNADEFLRGADLFVDGIDFFEFDVRRLLFQRARELGTWSITAGPIGFGAAWLVFDPSGMSFDRYFDVHDDMSRIEKLVAFLVGVCPKGLQRAYQLGLDHPDVDIASSRAPSLGLACQMCGSMVTAEASKILLGRGNLRPVPHYNQFDSYISRFASGTLRWGNRNLIQRIKRRILSNQLKKLQLPIKKGVMAELPSPPS